VPLGARNDETGWPETTLFLASLVLLLPTDPSTLRAATDALVPGEGDWAEFVAVLAMRPSSVRRGEAVAPQGVDSTRDGF
jgi:hypothetical protein